MAETWLFTSESVTEGHPDKVADQISDAVLDACLAQDPKSRVACECLLNTGLAMIAGEITTKADVDYFKVVRDTIRSIGYTKDEYGINADTCSVQVALEKQSPDISVGVTETESHEQGAGDQGLMFGYATNETPEFMPLPIVLAHKLSKRLAEVRKDGTLKYLRPDGKSQVTVAYVDGKPTRLDSVNLAAQHNPDVSLERIRADLLEHVVKPVCGDWIDEKTSVFVNGTGRFVLGGPQADTGLTGRKIIVDTYGGHGSHGGGCFSGKDPSKVDRSGTYIARHIAKNIVAAGLADSCEVQISYIIGVAKPTCVFVDTFGTSKVPEDDIEKAVVELWDLRPGAVISYLNMLRPIYRKTAAYGHFGRNDPDFAWEKTDKVDELRKRFNLA